MPNAAPPPSEGASPPRGSGPRDRVEIVGLGEGRHGFRLLRLNGVEPPEAQVLLDLHSALRVRIGERIYDEDDADIVVLDA